MATYIIGDIQGCFDEFILLLDKINYTPSKDSLYLAGDILNRGPKSLEVLDWCTKNSPNISLGNHDLHFLARFYNLRPGYKDDTLDIILNSPKSLLNKWVDYLKQQPLIHSIQTNQKNNQKNNPKTILIPHAGICPLWTEQESLNYAQEVQNILSSSDTNLIKKYLSNMYGNTPKYWSNNLKNFERLRVITNFLTRIRLCDQNYGFDTSFKGPLDQTPKNLYPWYIGCEKTNILKPNTQIIFGHWAALNGNSLNNRFINIDTGCVWGGQLTAYILETGEFIRISRLSM